MVPNWPIGQSVQVFEFEAATVAENLPAEQSVQVLGAVAAAAEEYLPAVQPVHGDSKSATSEYCPATQLAQKPPATTSLIWWLPLSATAMYRPSEEKDTP
jgi:hypothetical protein